MLTKGMTLQYEMAVAFTDTAKSQGSGLVEVLATPRLIALMEGLSAEMVKPHLEDNQNTVGTKVDMEHLAASPVGMKIVIKSELIEIDGRRLVFSVDAFDEVEQIGRCRHERFIIQTEKFMARVEAKKK